MPNNVKPDTFDEYGKKLTGVLSGLLALLPKGTQSIPIKGKSTAISTITTQFQAFVAANKAVDDDEQTLKASRKKRQQLRSTTEPLLTGLIKWIEVNLGPEAVGSLSLPVPQPPKRSTTKTAIGIAKRQAKAAEKKAAKQAAAAKQERLVALDANGNPIGGGGTPSGSTGSGK
jgi:hypothetical protein